MKIPCETALAPSLTIVFERPELHGKAWHWFRGWHYFVIHDAVMLTPRVLPKGHPALA